MQYGLVEKKNRLHLHGIFESKERAEKHLKETIPLYVARGYFMDKSLKANSFKVVRLKAYK